MRVRRGAGDERVGRHSAERARRRAGLRTGWQAGPSVTHERASRCAGFNRARWLCWKYALEAIIKWLLLYFLVHDNCLLFML